MPRPPLLVLGLLLVGACARPAADCYEASGGLRYDYATTDSWRLGPLPLWTTPAAVARVYGPADPAPADTGFTRKLMGPTRTRTFGSAESAGEDSPPTFDLIGDTLAYPNVVSLRGRSLQTDRGAVRYGDPVEEVAALFPVSAACSGENASDWLYREPGRFDTFVAVADSARRARVAFLFRGDSLVAIGVAGYEGWSRTQRQASG